MVEGTDLLATGGVSSIFGGICTMVHKFLSDRKIEKLEDKISETRLHIAENYVTKEGMKEAFTPVVAQLIRMEAKIDAMAQKKADK